MVLDVDPQKRRISLGLKQMHAQSVGELRRELSGRHRARGRGQEHHRVRPLRRPARRHRRHGASLRHRLAEAPAKRRSRTTRRATGQGARARRRCREGAHQPRHQAAGQRSARDRASPRSRRATSSPAPSPRSATAASRCGSATALPGFIRKAELSRDRAEQRPDRFAVGEKIDAKVTALDRATRKADALDQGARGRRGEEGDGRVRLVRLRREPRRHPRRGAQPTAGEGEGIGASALKRHPPVLRDAMRRHAPHRASG